MPRMQCFPRWHAGLAVVVALALGLACSRPPATAPGAGAKNVLRWSTRAEKETVGFDVYRAERREGPFERLTAQPVPGAGATAEMQSYAYEDASIDPAKEYFYYVECVRANGERLRVTGVIRAKPKRAG